MNCMDFRRRMLTDPYATEADLLAHEADCPDCAPFARELRAQEIRLRGLMQAVTPPAGMAGRIQAAARCERRGLLQRRRWLGAAAGLLIAVGAGLLSLDTPVVERGRSALAQSVLDHIEDEAAHLRATQPVAAQRVRFVLARFGAELTGEMGPVLFAAECPMRAHKGVHLVMPGQHGPITVFFMPGEMIASASPVGSPRLAGRIIPTGWGSIAVVGENGEPLEGLAERLAAAVRWPQTAALDSDLVGAGVFDDGRLAQQQDA